MLFIYHYKHWTGLIWCYLDIDFPSWLVQNLLSRCKLLREPSTLHLHYNKASAARTPPGHWGHKFLVQWPRMLPQLQLLSLGKQQSLQWWWSTSCKRPSLKWATRKHQGPERPSRTQLWTEAQNFGLWCLHFQHPAWKSSDLEQSCPLSHKGSPSKKGWLLWQSLNQTHSRRGWRSLCRNLGC